MENDNCSFGSSTTYKIRHDNQGPQTGALDDVSKKAAMCTEPYTVLGRNPGPGLQSQSTAYVTQLGDIQGVAICAGYPTRLLAL